MSDFTRVVKQAAKRLPLPTFQELRSVLEKNVHIKMTVEPISNEILEEVNNVAIPEYYHFDSIELNITQNDIIKVKTWTDLLLSVTNSEYIVSQDSMKDSLFQKKCLSIQQRIDSELKGTPYVRQRKRLLEAYGSEGGGATFSAIQKDPLLADVLCYLDNIQAIILKHESNNLITVSFSPCDPRNWSHDKKTYVVDCNEIGASLIMQEIVPNVMYDYIHSLEYVDPVCIINWPLASGTKEEFMDRLGGCVDKKEKKDILAARIGRIDAMKVFSSWKSCSRDDL